MRYEESKVLEAAREWALSLEHDPSTYEEKKLLVAVYEAYRQDFNHQCGCESRCEDCGGEVDVKQYFEKLRQTVKQEQEEIEKYVETVRGDCGGDCGCGGKS